MSSFSLYSQVTIGSKFAPRAGALLDLKQKEITDGGVTSTKGLGMPRVSLVALDQLEPCTVTNDDNKKASVGLTVYNVNDNSDTDGTLKMDFIFGMENYGNQQD